MYGYQSKDLIKLMEHDSSIKISQLRVDGGMIHNSSFIQFLSDILNIKIIIPKYSESTALGAAYLAAIGIKLTTLKKIELNWKKEKIYNSKITSKIRKKLYIGWIKAVKKTLLYT